MLLLDPENPRRTRSKSNNAGLAGCSERKVGPLPTCRGHCLAMSGGLVQEIQQETGAQVLIDQTTSNLGYSTVLLKGMADQACYRFVKTRLAAAWCQMSQVDNARDRVNAALEKAAT